MCSVRKRQGWRGPDRKPHLRCLSLRECVCFSRDYSRSWRSVAVCPGAHFLSFFWFGGCGHHHVPWPGRGARMLAPSSFPHLHGSPTAAVSPGVCFWLVMPSLGLSSTASSLPLRPLGGGSFLLFVISGSLHCPLFGFSNLLSPHSHFPGLKSLHLDA